MSRVGRVLRSDRAWMIFGVIMLSASAAFSAYVTSTAVSSAENARQSADEVLAVQEAEEAARCQNSKERSEAVRGAIGAAVDALALYAGLDNAQRAAVLDVVERRVIERYPAPDC